MTRFMNEEKNLSHIDMEVVMEISKAEGSGKMFHQCLGCHRTRQGASNLSIFETKRISKEILNYIFNSKHLLRADKRMKIIGSFQD